MAGSSESLKVNEDKSQIGRAKALTEEAVAETMGRTVQVSTKHTIMDNLCKIDLVAFAVLVQYWLSRMLRVYRVFDWNVKWLNPNPFKFYIGLWLTLNPTLTLTVLDRTGTWQRSKLVLGLSYP